ncbi:unnamed protein product [Nippostrongylus brasiliensis]|uniref:Transposase n=1 Tax=Nippostrongylus brasiliensis TaxID=27835 RepID=A0A0N4Y0B5_NIPBR|nr:unnamed protein product [Nippostrongylus brasiliensis]
MVHFPRETPRTHHSNRVLVDAYLAYNRSASRYTNSVSGSGSNSKKKWATSRATWVLVDTQATWVAEPVAARTRAKTMQETGLLNLKQNHRRHHLDRPDPDMLEA